MGDKAVLTTARNALAFNYQLAVAAKFSLIAAVIVAFYFQDLSMVFKGALSDESMFHILAIPFLFVYLAFRKRKMVSASLQPSESKKPFFQRYLSTLVGSALMAVAILTYWYGSYSFTPLEYHMLTLPFFVAGLVLIFFNVQTLKHLLFPIAFLVFLTPPPAEILFGLGSALANLSALASNSLANVFGLHAALSSSNAGPVITLTTPDNTVLPFNVSVACSGIYSIIGFFIFAIFIAYITRGKLQNKFVLLLLGIPLIVLLNIIRITIVLAIGYNFGEDLALQFFHSVGATVLMFVGTLVLLAVNEKLLKKPELPTPCSVCGTSSVNLKASSCPSCGRLLLSRPKIKLSKSDLIRMAAIVLVAVVLLSIQAPVFALTKGPAEVTVQTPAGTVVNTQVDMFPPISGYNLEFSYEDTAYEEVSGNDAALVYSYSPNVTGTTVWVAMQIGDSAAMQHRWETCLINFPLSQGDEVNVNQLDLRDITIQENPPILARYFAFQYKDTNQSQVVLYWFQTAVFNTNSSAQTKNVMFSLIVYASDAEKVADAEALELPIATAIIEYWQPIQTWSSISMVISQNGLTLSSLAIVVLLALVFYAVYLDFREKNLLTNIYGKLSSTNKLVITAVSDAQKQSNSTLEGIAVDMQKLTQTTVDHTWLADKLTEAQNAGLIKQVIVNKRDEPVVYWKTEAPQSKGFVSWLRTLF